MAGWVGAIQNGLSDEQREAGFIGSAEYTQKYGDIGAAWIQGMYQDLLGRTPAPSEVNLWLTALAEDVSPTTVAYEFAASPGRPPAASEVQAGVMAFEDLGYSNEDVIAGFVGSDEYFAKHAT
jgi:hypothetical protein